MAGPSFAFSFAFTSKIWQVVLDAGTGHLVLELRNEDTQEIKYQMINLGSLGSEKSFDIPEADWWTTVLRFYHPYLLLERYNDPQNPLSKDLLVYDTHSLSLNHVLTDFQFIQQEGAVLIGHVPGDQTNEQRWNLDALTEALPEDNVRYPVYYAPGSEHFNLVKEFLEVDEAPQGFEYDEYGEYIIISYYERLGTKFDRKLLVMQGDVELYHEVVDTGLNGYASGSFFTFKNLLVFIQNGNQIHAIEL
ncbi:MAG: DUF4905 domain-containing protein [Marinoscillum sp.]|uniref:DUF4905 domain-containing protein n=1 Tax=Marinoscillum sp. TaxID=2024838 RepID=UPI0033046241